MSQQPAPPDNAIPQTSPTASLRVVKSKVKVGEKLSYALGDVGSNLIYQPLTAFALFYLTNIAGIGAAIAGTILLLGQLLNGVTDLVLGVLIDKTRTRWGKTRPWILFSALPMALCLIAVFAIPTGLDETGKVVWAFVAYALVMAVFYTASNVAYSALLSVITSNPRTRVTLTSMRFIFAVFTSLIVTTVTLPAVNALGGGQGAWTTIAVIYGVISVVTFLVVFFGTRERIIAVDDEQSSAKQPLKVMLGQLFRNRYFLLAAALFLLFYLVSGLSQAVGVYYAADILHSEAAFSLLSLVGIFPLLLGIPFMPWLMGKFGKRPLFLVGTALMLVGALLPVIDPRSLPIVLIGGVLRGFGMVPLTAGIFALVADVVDYGEWKNGVRTDGLIFSSVVFGQKLGGGLASAGTGWILAIGGYAAGAQTQTAGAEQAILTAYVYVPIVLTVLIGVVVWFFRIERYRPQIEIYLAQHDAPADQAVSADTNRSEVQ